MREPKVVSRIARPDEFDVAARIARSVMAESTAPRGMADLEALVNSANGSWLVALVQDEHVGVARFANPAIPRPVIYLVAVHPKARGLGVGANLVDEFRRLCREAGEFHVDAYALPGDRATKNLYERAGLTARMIIASGSSAPSLSEPSTSGRASR